MTAAVYFISDLHLDAERPAVTRALFDFLQKITGDTNGAPASALYILGDLFEFWVGDDDDSPLVGEVADALREFSESGPDLYLMHGNRDFLIGADYAARAGAQLLDDPVVVTTGGNDLLLMHGDSLCTRDEDYQRFRTLARSPEWKADVLARSLDERRRLAAQLRMASRDAGSRKAADIMDVTPSEVERIRRETGVRTLIHGHTHRPARHDEPGGTRWVLGDWDAQGWFLRHENGELQLNKFDVIQ
ncbi:MAG: UDP-2,3-diacylglucosamine diphosphatase [Pseudomonadota bacterium]